MRPITPSLCALVLALLAAAPVPAAAADEASIFPGAAASARPLAAAPSAEFSRAISLTVGQVKDLAPAQLVSSLARAAEQPAPSAAEARRAVLAALWSPPEVSAALIQRLQTAGSEAALAAADLSRLIDARRPQIDAQRARIAQEVPELRRLALPLSASELFDGERQHPSKPFEPAVLETEAERAAPALSAHNRASAEKPVPSVDRPAPKQGFLSRHRHVAAYSVVLGLSANAMELITHLGRGLVGHAPAVLPGATSGMAMAGLLSPVPLFFAQIAVIIGVGKLFSLLFSRLGQPAVVGYVIAGLALGPSLLGVLAPLTAAALFPAASLSVIQLVSQVGLIAFMFCVGHELDLGALRKQSGAAGLISHASIFIPFVLGAALSLLLFPVFAPAGVPFLAFCLFSGIAMSITAFPVLASILHERGMTKTPLGGLAMAAAAIDDVSGWALLAFVLAVASGGSALAVGRILGLTAVYLAAMFGAVRPLLNRLAARFSQSAWYGPVSFVLLAALAAVSSIATERIGIHALFGAFLAGVVTPRGAGGLSEKAAGRIQRFSAAILLPAFFALTGLRTHLGLLASPALWGVAALVMAVAVAGKLGASALAARFSGMSWRDSFSIGALMNTRGLMELVVLNIAYDKGIISGPLFAVFVLMALVTTMLTGPLLKLLSRKPAVAQRTAVAAAD